MTFGEVETLAKGLDKRFYFIIMSKRNIDYAFKSYVLNEHKELLKQVKKSKLLEFKISQYYENGEITPFLERLSNEAMRYNDLIVDSVDKGLKREFSECIKIDNANYHRVKRLKDRVANMLSKGKCIFLTLTFNDLTLANTTEKERRVAVVRYLKMFKSDYVANIDFGTKNHREHYHALIVADKINYKKWNKYGNINGQKVRLRDFDNDKTKLSKYIAKLTNHAIKETTKRNALIYSR